MKSILERDSNGEKVCIDDPDYKEIKKIIMEAKRLTMKLNTQVLSCDEIREIFSELIGKEVDDSFVLWTPFYTDFGKNIEIGKNVFINHDCTFMDRGGIVIGDNTFIGPKVSIITTNHGVLPNERRILTSQKIIIGNNVWIGAGAIILPGVTIGDNTVIGAGAIITSDISSNAEVVGPKAKVIRLFE